MFIPLRTDCPLRRVPWTNWGLIALNFLVFFLTGSNASGTVHGPLFMYHGQIVKQMLALDPQDPHLWQFFTYQFVHENSLHIIGNMLFLYIFGNNINDRMGQFGYLAFYLAGGIMAGIGHVSFSTAPVIGASGAVAAVTGAFLVLLPQSNIMVFLIFGWIGAFEVAGIWFVLVFFAMDIVGQVEPELLGGLAVAHMAHISGTIFGALTCLCLLAFRLLPRDQFDVLALASRWNRRRQYRQMVSEGYDPFAYTPPKPVDVRPQEPDPRSSRMLELRGEISEAIAHHNLPHAAYLYLELKS
jgi:membrane associated rhomboid family serine protease